MLQPAHLDQRAITDQRVLGKVLSQRRGFARVAAIERRKCEKRGCVQRAADAYTSHFGVRIIHRESAPCGLGSSRSIHGGRFSCRTRQHGRIAGARVGVVGRADAARGQQFSDQRPANAAGVHPRVGAHQVGRRAHESQLGSAARGHCRRRRVERARGRERHARGSVSRRRVSDGLRHELEHERERGHRAARDASARLAGAPERSRQHEPEQQRLDPVGDSHRGRARAQEQAAAGARASRRDDRSQGARGRRHRQDGPHSFDGRDARAARPGARRLGGAAARQHAAVAGRDAAAHGARAGRHGRRHGHQRASEVRRRVRGRAREADRHRLPSGRRTSSRRSAARTRPSSCRASSRRRPSAS